MRRSCLALLVLGLPAVASAQATLELEQVLQSVEAHHPQIAGALARQARAEGEVLSEVGAFDPQLRGSALTRDGDDYGRTKVDVELFQPTPLWGTELYAGYRLGRSRANESWPTYDPNRTLPGGEVRAGVRVPFWRGGPIDERRANLRAARDRQRAAERGVANTLLDLRQAAMGAYWKWVAAGQTLQATQELLALAEKREEQLERAVDAGAVPAIELVDNRRMRFQRRERVAAARRNLQRAAYNLALYYRSEGGAPLTPEPERLPTDIDAPPRQPMTVDALRSTLLECHPKLGELRSEIAALEAELRLAENRVAPEAYAKFQVSRDLGDSMQAPALEGTAVEAGVVVSMPLALRPQRGARRAARAKLAEKEAQARWLADRIAINVSDIASRIQAAYQRYEAARGYLDAATTLAEGERERFKAGASNLLFVNLREQTATDARLSVVKTALEAHLARSEWQTLKRVTCS